MEKCCQVQEMKSCEKGGPAVPKFAVGNDLCGVIQKALESIIKNYTILNLGGFILPKSTKCFHI